MNDQGSGEPPADLLQAGAVVDSAIAHMLDRGVDPLSIASALLGGAVGLLGTRMSADAVLRVLDRAAASVRAGDSGPAARD